MLNRTTWFTADTAGFSYQLAITEHTPTRTPDPLTLRVDGLGYHATVTGMELHVNLHDNKTATLSVVEKDAAGFVVTGPDAVPVTWATDVDGTVGVLSDNGDGTATFTNAAPPAVGATATVTASATLPDGSTAQGTVAITIVSGPVTEIGITAVEA